MIPSDSKSENYVSVNFVECDVNIIKAIDKLNLPCLSDVKDTVKDEGKILVDMAQESVKED